MPEWIRVGKTGKIVFVSSIGRQKSCFSVFDLNDAGDPVKVDHTILISDRNRHVREFLRREMMAEGDRCAWPKVVERCCISGHTTPNALT